VIGENKFSPVKQSVLVLFP